MRILEEFIRLSGGKDIEGETNSFRKSDKRFGLESWPWELGCVYVEVLTDICIQSLNPQIKRRALLGFNKDAYEILETKLLANGFGLLEASRFQLNRLSQEGNIIIILHFDYMKFISAFEYFKMIGVGK